MSSDFSAVSDAGGASLPAGGPCVLVVDDVPQNLQLLADLLTFKWGYRTERARTGSEALAQAERLRPDLILLDVLMPDLDGFEVCRRLRADPAFVATPIVLVTSLDAREERIKGLEAGADDFLSKPIVQAELFARVRSLLRVKALYDEVSRQRSELELWSATLERRVEEKLAEIERLARLKRFFSPRLAAKLLGDAREDALHSHRREISVLFADLRGFTAFAEASHADDVMSVLREFHETMGRLIHEHEGTLERFTGDGMMVFFNDPDVIDNHTWRAVELGLAMCRQAALLQVAWNSHGGPAGVGIGIAKGVATLGAIGFESRLDYAAIGSVTNLASRLCAEADAGQLLVSTQVWADICERGLAAVPQTCVLKGFAQPVRCFRIDGTSQTLFPSSP
jgi:class 3 adenylate cyclase